MVSLLPRRTREESVGMTPDDMRKATITSLPAKTGRTLTEWVKNLKSDGPGARKERVAWLKGEHDTYS